MIRDLNPADADGIHQLLFGAPEAGQWSPRDFVTTERNSVCRVAEENGKISGFIVFRIIADQAEILNLAVELGCRRRGIASQLIKDVFGACQAAGIKTIFLEVRDSNEAGRKFYERMGFTEKSRRLKYYRQPLEDALVLKREVE